LAVALGGLLLLPLGPVEPPNLSTQRVSYFYGTISTDEFMYLHMRIG